MPRAAPRAIDSLVGQSNIFLFAGSPVVKLNFRINGYEKNKLKGFWNAYHRVYLAKNHWTWKDTQEFVDHFHYSNQEEAPGSHAVLLKVGLAARYITDWSDGMRWKSRPLLKFKWRGLGECKSGGCSDKRTISYILL